MRAHPPPLARAVGPQSGETVENGLAITSGCQSFQRRTPCFMMPEMISPRRHSLKPACSLKADSEPERQRPRGGALPIVADTPGSVSEFFLIDTTLRARARPR